MVKYGDVLVALGYQTLKQDKRHLWPEWLPRGEHRVMKVKASEWGVLVKTDRLPQWVNVAWFRSVL